MRRLLPFALLAAIAVQASAQSFTDSFDSFTAPPAAGGVFTSSVEWTATNLSSPVGTTGWFQGNLTVFGPNSGAGYIGANFNNTSGSTISNWLISPLLTLNNGDTISFYTRGPSNAFPDRLHLKLSTNGSSVNTGDFSTVLVSVNPNLGQEYPLVWTQFTATVSGLSGATAGRFAFHYDVTDAGPAGNNSNYIGIDDVGYQAVPEPATMAALAMGAVALLRRRKKAA